MNLQNFVALVARTFLSLIFVRSGIGKLFFDFAETQEQIAQAGVPLPWLMLIFTIAFQIIGGIAIILGYKAKLGAILLLIFIIPATLVFHNPALDPSQSIDFWKNLSIIGGLLMVAAFGAGSLSLDSRINKTNSFEKS
jgi:putative oxidoreductase